MLRIGHVAATVVTRMAASFADARISLERFEWQIEPIERQTRMQIRPEEPPEQRALIDLGGYITFNFLAIDDQNQNTRILRETNLNAYAMVNFDGVNEFCVRGRTTCRDFNTGDGFRSRDDDWIGPTLDRGHYRFDPQRNLWRPMRAGRSTATSPSRQGGNSCIGSTDWCSAANWKAASSPPASANSNWKSSPA